MGATVPAVPAAALKEWASVIAAMLAGEQIVMLRKGGIGEKHFDLPHREFLLLPTHVHQRPELLVPAARDTYTAELAVTEEPDRVTLAAWCEVTAVHTVTEQRELDAIAPFHVLGPDYASLRLRWRPTHPLVVIVARVHRVEPPLPLDMTPGMRGCRSWVPVDYTLPARAPVLGDAVFAAHAAAVAEALADAHPAMASGTATLG